MNTKPLHRYLMVTVCEDPSSKMRKVGSLEIITDSSTLDKNTNHVVPSLVLAVGPECTLTKPGDVVYLNPNFTFNGICDARYVGLVHEQFCLAVLPKEDVEALGIEDKQFTPKRRVDLSVAGPEVLSKLR